VLLSAPSYRDVECAAFDIIPYMFSLNKLGNMHEKHQQLLVGLYLLSTFCAFLEANKMIDVAHSHSLCDRSGEVSNFYERSLCTQ
jgi:hypothetical protein